MTPEEADGRGEGVTGTVERTGRPLRLVFLGCGLATRIHSRTLRRFRHQVECHFASRSAERARAYAERFGGGRAFGSYDEPLADPGIDAVLVATPPTSHLKLTEAALRAGKDVIVEKPPFLRSADFDAVERLARETGRRVLVAENYFYKPLARRLRQLLASGAVGEPLFVQVNALKRQPTGDWRDVRALAGGGALFEGGIHWINLIASLGPEVRSVRAVRAGRGPGPERSMAVALEFEGGAAGVLLHSWEAASPLKGLRLSRIYGREGSIAFESNGLVVLVWGRRKRIHFPGLRDISGYRSMFADFLQALRAGREPRMTLGRARRDLELVEESYRSAGVEGASGFGGGGEEKAR